VFTFSDIAGGKVPYDTIGLTDWVAATFTYSKTRGSTGEPAMKGFVFPLHGVASGPGGQAVPVGHLLSMQVHTAETVGVTAETMGVTPFGNKFRAVN
jgi:hypothetical protein